MTNPRTKIKTTSNTRRATSKEQFIEMPSAYEGNRHRGKKIGTLWAHLNGLEGDVTISKNLMEIIPDALARADILKDIIGLLEREYERSVKLICNENYQ